MNKNCICPSLDCERHGICKKCREFHKTKESKPFCKRGINVVESQPANPETGNTGKEK